MKRQVMIISALLLVGLLATAAFAQAGKRGHGGWPHEGRGMMAGFYGLNLTADQTTRMNTLRDRHWQEVQPLKDQMMQKRQILRNLWLENDPDPAKINAAQQDVRALRDQMADKRTAFRLSALEILTPEQKTEFQRLNRERGFRFGGQKGACPAAGTGFRGR
jgi:Spy/CpxP family protein refolding chaperone